MIILNSISNGDGFIPSLIEKEQEYTQRSNGRIAFPCWVLWNDDSKDSNSSK